MINTEVGRRLKESRMSSGLTQREVSERLGIVLQQYQTYESGRYQMDYDKIVRVCKILNVSADYFALELTKFKLYPHLKLLTIML